MIAKSLYNLTNHRNGFFKSEKQAAFLLSQRTDGNDVVTNSKYWKSFVETTFTLDEKGVTMIKVKKTIKWVRDEKITPDMADQMEAEGRAKKEARKEKELQRELLIKKRNKIEKRIKRIEAFKSGKTSSIVQEWMDSFPVEERGSEKATRFLKREYNYYQGRYDKCRDKLVTALAIINTLINE